MSALTGLERLPHAETEIGRYVLHGIHECAPDHSVNDTFVGELRRWAAASEAMAAALELVLPLLEERADEAACDYGAFIQEGGGVAPVALHCAMDEAYAQFASARDALAKARGDQ